MNNKYIGLIYIISLIFLDLLSSCDKEFCTYEYTVCNNSDEPISILLCNSKSGSTSDGTNLSSYSCSYYNSIKVAGKELTDSDTSYVEVELLPNEELTFVEIAPSNTKVCYYHAPWDYQSCILRIRKGEILMDNAMWLNRYNWRYTEVEYYRCQYLLCLE